MQLTHVLSSFGRRGARGAVIVTVCGVMLVASGCFRRQKVVYEMPNRFTGWVEVRYGIPAAPPLPEANGSFVIRVPASGVVETSTEFQEGFAEDTFHYVAGDQLEVREEPKQDANDMAIWGYSVKTTRVAQRRGPITVTFFVGQYAEYRRIRRGRFEAPASHD